MSEKNKQRGESERSASARTQVRATRSQRTDGGDKVQIRQTLRRKDAVGKAWDAAKDCRSEQDATDDLCDDLGLADLGEPDGEDVGEDEDERELDDEERDGVRRVVGCWVLAGEDSS